MGYDPIPAAYIETLYTWFHIVGSHAHPNPMQYKFVHACTLKLNEYMKGLTVNFDIDACSLHVERI